MPPGQGVGALHDAPVLQGRELVPAPDGVAAEAVALGADGRDVGPAAHHAADEVVSRGSEVPIVVELVIGVLEQPLDVLGCPDVLALKIRDGVDVLEEVGESEAALLKWTDPKRPSVPRRLIDAAQP